MSLTDCILLLSCCIFSIPDFSVMIVHLGLFSLNFFLLYYTVN